MERSFLDKSIKEEVNRYNNVVERSAMLGKGLIGLMKTKEKLQTWLNSGDSNSKQQQQVDNDDEGYLMNGASDDENNDETSMNDNHSQSDTYDKPSSLIDLNSRRNRNKTVTIQDEKKSNEEVANWVGAAQKIDGSHDWSRRQTSTRGASLRQKVDRSPPVPAARPLSMTPSQPPATGNAVAKFPYVCKHTHTYLHNILWLELAFIFYY